MANLLQVHTCRNKIPEKVDNFGMKAVPIATVRSAIDYTAHQRGVVVAIEYVKQNGDVVKMKITKSVSGPKRPLDKRPTSNTNYNIRNRGLIRVIDVATDQPKSLFLFAIIGFNPVGNTNKLHPVIHGS
jgi:hypothetical protein